WTLRMPLSTPSAGWGYITLYRECGGEGMLLDVNYLSNLFQKEMALATERVFTAAGAEEPLGEAVAAVLS
ncbi:MAG TPA: hypothetical protein VNZ44_01790, partial [Pyrinomonadaceae bacterium]|nr:hypothetical protein [Pyrinomonadaceae bacterium]